MLSCLVVQAVGGALAASAGGGQSHGAIDVKPNLKMMDAGNKTIVVGICLQVASGHSPNHVPESSQGSPNSSEAVARSSGTQHIILLIN